MEKGMRERVNSDRNELGVVACPVCDSRAVRKIRWAKRRSIWLTIRTPRECTSCGTWFVPRGNMLLRSVAVVFGVCMFLGLFGVPMIEAARYLFGGHGNEPDWVEILACGLPAALTSLYVAEIGIRGGRARILTDEQDVDDATV